MSSDPFRMDLFVEGSGVRRDALVAVAGVGLICGDLTIPYADVFWISRRLGMLLVFATGATLAVKGSGRELEHLYDKLTEHVDVTELRRRIVRQLGHEIVLFTAGCAAVGKIGTEKVGGLYVGATTRRALYLLSRDRRLSVEWPARAEKRSVPTGDGEGAGSDHLALEREGASLVLRYLFPEEIGALLYAASAKTPVDAASDSLELFRRKEVAPPPAPGLPEFSMAAGALQEVAERAAANVPGELQSRALMPPYFFETHFLELGEIALGPLLLRKSAASHADSLRRAVEAMNAGGLQSDTRAAVATATDRMTRVYDEELGRLLSLKRVPPRQERDFTISDTERQHLALRMQSPFERLWTRFEDLGEQERYLLHMLEELDEGPPDDDDIEVQRTAADWRATMKRLDSGYEGAWRELVEEIEKYWSTNLLPRLARVVSLERRRVPEWLQLVALGVVTLVLAAALVFILVV